MSGHWDKQMCAISAADLETLPNAVVVSARKLVRALDEWADILDRASEAVSDGGYDDGGALIEDLRDELRQFSRSCSLVVAVFDQHGPTFTA